MKKKIDYSSIKYDFSDNNDDDGSTVDTLQSRKSTKPTKSIREKRKPAIHAFKSLPPKISQISQIPKLNNSASILFYLIIAGIFAVTIGLVSIYFIQNNSDHDSETVKKRSIDDCGIGKISEKGRCVPIMIYPDNHNPSLIENSTDPCINMYHYACGKFVDAQCPLGEDDFHNLAHIERVNSDERYDSIMQEIEKVNFNYVSESEKLIGNFYMSCKSSLLKQESKTVQELLELVSQSKLNADISFAMGKMASYDMIVPFSFSRELDPLNTSNIVDCFVPDGLFNTTKERIMSLDHKLLIQNRMQKIGSYSERRSIIESESVIEIELYIHHLIEKYSEPVSFIKYVSTGMYTRELVRFSSLKNWMDKKSGFDLNAFFRGLGTSTLQNSIFVWAHVPDFFKNFDLNAFDVIEWARYLSYSILESSTIYNIKNDNSISSHGYTFHRGYDPQHALPWNRPRKFLHASLLSLENEIPEECVDMAMSYLPVLLDIHFIKSIPSKDLELARIIAEHIRSAFIESAPSYAISQKLSQLTIDIGFPEDWPPSRNSLSIERNSSFVDNILEIRRFHVAAELSASSHAMRYMYDTSVSSANAFYHMQTNNLIVNAGLMKAPIFSSAYNLVSLYARFGFIVAHEISHSIDPIGVLFDVSGNISPNSRHLFTYQNECVTSQTANEDIADIMGLRMAFKALQTHLSTATSSSNSIEDFFVDFSQLWCACISKNTIDYIVLNGRHSLPWNRVNLACHSNTDFLSLFQCSANNNNNNNICTLPI